MSILDRQLGIETRNIRVRRMSEPERVTAVTSELPTSNEVYNGFTYEQGYETRVVVATRWFANRAQFHIRKRLAEKEILHFLYGPLLQRLHELRARAYDRDYREVLRVVDEIEKELVE